MKPIDKDDVCFRGHEQTPQGLPVWDGGQARWPRRARQQGAQREARSKRPMPMWFHEIVSSAVASEAAAFDGSNRHHYRRW